MTSIAFIAGVIPLIVSSGAGAEMRYAMGIAVFFLWCVNAAISFVFPLLVEAAGATVTFALFAAINVVSFGFVK